MATYTFIAHDISINGGNINVVGSSTYTIVLTDDDKTIGDPGDGGEMISINGGPPQPYSFQGVGLTDNTETMIVIDVGGQLLAFDTDGGQLQNGNTKVGLSDLVDDPVVPCFTPGTGILTPRGEVLIDALREGDLLTTRSDGPMPVKKIIRRRVSRAELRLFPQLAPISISAGAMGDNVPTRDLQVSPQHRFLVSDWRSELLFGTPDTLATARSMVNGISIRRGDAGADVDVDVDYIHLLLDDHQIICANGAWTETVLLSQGFLSTLPKATANELSWLFPELLLQPHKPANLSAAPMLRHYEGRLASQL